jgi:glycosyltransferase involved in cell wall biosynthesis
MVTQDAPSMLPDGVEALGRLSDEDLAREYRAAWVFCLPSAYEGFGIPYAEAMTSGVPVVATPNHGARYVTDDGRYGVLVELDELGAKLAEVLRVPALRERLGAASLERAKEFDLRSVVDRYERVYRSARA